MLDVLGSRQIPVIAVFSARDPNHPSVFRGSYTQEEILAALEAGRAVAGAGGVARCCDAFAWRMVRRYIRDCRSGGSRLGTRRDGQSDSPRG